MLVTGGAGYIGSHTVLALRDAGAEAVVLDDLSTGVREAVPAGVAFEPGSTLDREGLLRLLRRYGVTSVMHFAASLIVPDSVARPLAYYRNNVAGCLALAEACAEAGIGRLIFSSTAAVYGEPAAVPVAETAPALPLTPYGASKLMAERILADAAAAHGLDLAVLRYFNVAGADPRGRAGQRTRSATHLVKVAAEVAAGRRPVLEIYGTDYPTPDGTCVRDYIHVADLVEAHLLLLGHLRRDGGRHLVNVGYGRGFSVREVVRAVERAAGRPLPLREAGRRPGDAARLVADATLLRDRYGWRPSYDDIDTIVRSALDWERTLDAAPSDGRPRPAAGPG
ncbi:UDP-glucose 4-epimerase [Rhodospirillum centenum SW]|uniref:UDP-glucose 4-epimerase n=1 Tax=Rhodospirillum centenum (strain ATCC 51521 / SW) TaxID=414684 RepID=B6IYJ9_RHOCS|nr:UDP-glucose 4-epimerase [Rhodospirillum centenum SW]